jgi:hypothetical protein
MPAINQNAFKPFLSVAFLEAHSVEIADGGLAKVLQAEAKEVINSAIDPAKQPAASPQKWPIRSVIDSPTANDQQGIHIATLVYSHKGPPSWLAETRLIDEVHHLVVIAVQESRVALACSDTAMRDHLAKSLKSATLLSGDKVAEAFVGSDAKTIWLTGVHARTAVKADSKTLAGSALENALDPIGDQSYALSAIRSQPKVQGLGEYPGRVVVGAAPSASRIWLGRPNDWLDFVGQIKLLLTHLKHRHRATELYHFLSRPVPNLSNVNMAYGIAVLPSAMLAEDAGLTEDERREMSRWAYDTFYNVKGTCNADLSVNVTSQGEHIGQAELTVSANTTGRVSISAKWVANIGKGSKEDRSACLKYLRDPRQVKVHYDSGHAIADGNCYLAGWTDHLLTWEFCDLSGYNLWQEKPKLTGKQKLADQIGVLNDKSLFAYVQRDLFHEGWLACDDGAMEIADFIHLNLKTDRLTLVHVKGAGHKTGFKELSVSDYEVVVSQGVKNIRHLTPVMLADALEKGTNKDIARAVWLDGERKTDRKDMITAIRNLPAHAPRTLLILQPRLSEATHDACKRIIDSKSAEVIRFKQLNALMLGARVAAMGAGAEFRAISAK